MERKFFFDEVHDFQRYIRNNIRIAGNYTIISEQISVVGNEMGIMDIFAIDNDQKRIVILELKNELTTDKNIWQPLRYYDLCKRSEDDLKRLLIETSHLFDYDIDEIDLTPQMVMVVPLCNEQLLRTLSYLEGLDIKVVEVMIYQNGDNIETFRKTHFPYASFYKEDTARIKSKVTKNWSFSEYINHGVNAEKINIAKDFILKLKKVTSSRAISIDTFFGEKGITLILNQSVWGTLHITSSHLDYKLSVSLKLGKRIPEIKNQTTYDPSFEKLKIDKKGIKFLLNSPISYNMVEMLLNSV